MKTLLQEFEEFVAKSYPQGTTPDQKRQLAMAWMAGSMIALEKVSRAAEEKTEDEAVQVLQDMLHEGVRFCRARCAKHVQGRLRDQGEGGTDGPQG